MDSTNDSSTDAENPENSGSSKAGRWFTESLVMASAPVVGYIIAYQYESGYIEAFKLPTDFIQVNPASVLIATIIAVAVSLQSIALGNNIYAMLGTRRKGATISGYIFVALVMAGVCWAFWFDKLLGAITIAVVMYVIQFYSSLRSSTEQVQIPMWRKKLNELLKYPLKEGDEQPLHKVVGDMPKRFAVAAAAFILAITCSYGAGRVHALRQRYFLVLPEQNEKVVLRVYADQVICAPFDRKSKSLLNGFIIKEFPGDNGLFMRYEKVGPLKAAPLVK